MDRPCYEHIEEALTMARELMVLADESDANGDDDGCCILAGVMRDCAHKILNEATRQRKSHRGTGQWPGGKDGDLSG